MTHTVVLFIAYSTVALVWLGASRALSYWRSPERPSFEHPWRELGYAISAAILVILIGQLYVRGIRLPNKGGWRPFTESLNQLAIFLPVVLLPVVRRQPWTTMWLPRGHVLQRLTVGIALSMVALLIFVLFEKDAPGTGRAFVQLFSPSSVPIAVQVFLEDLAIAMLVVRLAAAISPRWAIVTAAVLFALGHLPAMLAGGMRPAELLGLLRDVALGTLLLSVAWRSGDILWFWPVHTVMDLTQFMTVSR